MDDGLVRCHVLRLVFASTEDFCDSLNVHRVDIDVKVGVHIVNLIDAHRGNACVY